MSEFTATEILSHCKAVCEGKIPQPLPFWVTGEDVSETSTEYIIWHGEPSEDDESTIVLFLWAAVDSIPAYNLELAARILGLDHPSPVGEFGYTLEETERNYIALKADHEATVARLTALIDSPAPVVLEWVEIGQIEGLPASEAIFNDYIRLFVRPACDYLDPVGKWDGCVFVAGQDEHIYSKWCDTESEARAWCKTQIQKITTPTPRT